MALDPQTPDGEPLVPRRPDGHVLLGVLGAIMAGFVFLAGGLLALVDPAQLGHRVGLVDATSAVVVEREYAPARPSGFRGGGACARYLVTVDLGGRLGGYDVCLREPFSDREVGDRVDVAAVPWTSIVHPVGRSAAGLWIPVLCVLVLGLAPLAWRYLSASVRLRRGLARGPSVLVVITEVRTRPRREAVPTLVAVVRVDARPHAADTDDDGAATWRLTPLLRTRHPLAAGRHAEVWAVGRSLVRRRAISPWVVRLEPSGPTFVATGRLRRHRA